MHKLILSIVVGLLLTSSVKAEWCVIPPGTVFCGDIAYLELYQKYIVDGESDKAEVLEDIQVCETATHIMHTWREKPDVDCHGGFYETTCFRLKDTPTQKEFVFVFADTVLCESSF